MTDSVKGTESGLDWTWNGTTFDDFHRLLVRGAELVLLKRAFLQKFLPTATCSKAAHSLRISATRTADLCRRHRSFRYQTVLYICEAPWGYVVFICFTTKGMNILQIDAGSKDAGDSERTLVWEVLCSRPSKQSLGEECPVHRVWLIHLVPGGKKLRINLWPIRCDWLVISEF